MPGGSGTVAPVLKEWDNQRAARVSSGTVLLADGHSPHALALPQTQLQRCERTGALGGLRALGFQEAPAAEPAHPMREAKSL